MNLLEDPLFYVLLIVGVRVPLPRRPQSCAARSAPQRRLKSRDASRAPRSILLCLWLILSVRSACSPVFRVPAPKIGL